VTATEFFQSHKVREWLEPEAVELAAPNIAREQIEDLRKRIEILATAEMQERAHWEVDDQLHLLFADASGNAVLANIIRQVRVTTRLFEISNPLRRVHQDGEEHLAILQALSDGDAKGARKAMLRHVRNLVSDTLAILRGL
jgi:DNA-binding GntR family transcriptional regulator